MKWASGDKLTRQLLDLNLYFGGVHGMVSRTNLQGCKLCKFLLITFEPAYSVIADKTLLNLRELYKNKVNIKLI